MNVKKLIPSTTHSAAVRATDAFSVSEGAGCFVLATNAGEIVSIGKSTSLESLFVKCIQSQRTRDEASGSRQIVFFHWRLAEDVYMLERTWLKRQIRSEGRK